MVWRNRSHQVTKVGRIDRSSEAFNLAGHGGDGQRWGLVDDFDMDVGQNGRPRGPQM